MELIEGICEDFYATGLAVCDDFVSKEEAAALLVEIMEDRGNLKKAGIGSGTDLQVNEKVRGDHIRWIGEKEKIFQSLYLEKLGAVIQSFNRRFYLGIQNSEHHITYYPAGTHYEKHVDTFKDSDARVVSSVLYLNTDWQPAHGGELCVYTEGGLTKIEPRAGRLVLFESTLAHEVLECKAPRYSITGWFKRNTFI